MQVCSLRIPDALTYYYMRILDEAYPVEGVGQENESGNSIESWQSVLESSLYSGKESAVY